jgi:N-acetyl-anhydromuramyl-L-alanine amidase AmpD
MSKLPDIYPFVHKIGDINTNLVDRFEDGDPSGVTIHYTASRNIDSVIDTLANSKLNYHFIIDRQGHVYQNARLTHSVYHAGKAEWKGKSPNKSFISIALLNWGLLDDTGRTWAGQRLPDDETHTRHGKRWDKCTLVQEERLLVLCKWLVCQGIYPDMICGHDECCIPPGRKTDPGGIMSYDISQLRKLVVSVIS